MIDIILANAEYAKALTTLAVRTFKDSHAHSASEKDIADYVSNHMQLMHFEQELSNPENLYHLMYVEGSLAGYSKIKLNTGQESVKSTSVTKLERIYFDKDFYGKGLSKDLLDHNIEVSKQAGQQGMWLAVWTENRRAIGFYQKMGFEKVGKYDFKISATHYNPNHIMFLPY